MSAVFAVLIARDRSNPRRLFNARSGSRKAASADNMAASDDHCSFLRVSVNLIPTPIPTKVTRRGSVIVSYVPLCSAMVPEERIELSTYPLPRGCATTTLLRLRDTRAAPEGGCYTLRICTGKEPPNGHVDQGFRPRKTPRRRPSGEPLPTQGRRPEPRWLARCPVAGRCPGEGSKPPE